MPGEIDLDEDVILRLFREKPYKAIALVDKAVNLESTLWF